MALEFKEFSFKVFVRGVVQGKKGRVVSGTQRDPANKLDELNFVKIHKNVY